MLFLFVCLIVSCLSGKDCCGVSVAVADWYVNKILSYVVCGKRSEISIKLICTAPQQNKQSLRNTHTKYRIFGGIGGPESADNAR